MALALRIAVLFRPLPRFWLEMQHPLSGCAAFPGLWPPRWLASRSGAAPQGGSRAWGGPAAFASVEGDGTIAAGRSPELSRRARCLGLAGFMGCRQCVAPWITEQFLLERL